MNEKNEEDDRQKFPSIWVRHGTEWHLEDRVNDFGERNDGSDDNFRELTEEERIALLECVYEFGNYGQWQEYVDLTGYKSKCHLYRYVDQLATEWDPILEQMIVDEYDDVSKLEDAVESECPNGLHHDVAKAHPELVTLYVISCHSASHGFLDFVLAINEHVFPEVTRQAFLSWAEKLLAA